MLKPDTSGYPANTRHSTTYCWIQCIMYITKSISCSNTSKHFSFLCGPKKSHSRVQVKNFHFSFWNNNLPYKLENMVHSPSGKGASLCISVNFHKSENSDCGTFFFCVRLYTEGETVGSYPAPHVEYWRTLAKKSRHREVNMMEARDCSVLVTHVCTMVPL